MKIIVSDTSSLILLSKSSVLEKTCSRHQINIPLSVEQEASALSLREKYADAAHIHHLIRKGMIIVRKLKSPKKKMPIPLGPGETDAILLFHQLKADLLLTDDGKAIKACRMLMIPFIISPKIVLDLYKNKDVSLDEALLSLERIRIAGRYSPDIIAEVLLKVQQEKINV